MVELRTQRVMVGPGVHATPDDVVRAWEEMARLPGFLAIRKRRGDFSTDLRRSGARLVAYVSAGSWTASCPECNGGVPAWPPDRDGDGHEIGCCLDCGTVYRLDYPPREEIEAATETLMARPPEWRDWHPHKGETVETLRGENIAHGYHPTRELAAQQQQADREILARLLKREGDAGADFLRRIGVEV